jgi:hypothetical protein
VNRLPDCYEALVMTPRHFALGAPLIDGLLTTDWNYVSMWVRRARRDQEIACHSRSRSIGRWNPEE